MWKNREAHLCLFSVLLALLPSASSFNGNSKYMVLVPSQLYTDTPEKICLHLYHLNETVTVTASLISQRGTRKLFDELVVDKDLFHCLSFTIPRLPSSEEEESLDINIEGAKHKFSKRRVVLVKNKESVVFVQTDKPVYKPGQSVKFRIVSMDKNLHPLNELFPLAYIEDPKINRIMQWQDIKTENGLKQLSFSLSAEPIQGPYKIVILKQSGVKEEHSFTVMEFVLPRFGVDVKVPNAISVYDEIISVTACATYTYGKPVPGRVKISLCHGNPSFRSQTKSACKEEDSELDNNGCSTQEVNITEFRLKENYLKVRQAFHVNATVTEEGTGSEFSGSGRIEVKRTRNKFLFLKADSHFRHGIPFFVKVRLVNIKGDPIPNQQVFIKAQGAGFTNATTTDQHGLAKFSIDTSGISRYILNIKVYHKEENSCIHSSCTAERHAEAHHTAYAVYSLSKSYIYLDTEAGVLPCNQSHTVQAHFILKGQVLGVLPQIVFHYLVMAQGSILQTGNHTHQVEPGESPVQGNFALEIPVEFSMVPMAKMLIYTILPDGEVIADSVKFQVEKCLRHEVHLSFSPSQSLPASQTHMRVTASPQSLCGLRAVDQSVLLLKPEAELSPSLIYDLPGMQESKFIPRSHYPFEDEDGCVIYRPRVIGKLTYSVPYGREKDVFRYMRDTGLTALTNLKLRTFCFDYDMVPLAVPAARSSDLFNSDGYGSWRSARVKSLPPKKAPHKDPPPKDPVIETIRNYFPETWVWDLVTVNSSGAAELEMTVPDTITEWKAGALCLSNDTGLGLSSVATLQAFQPFFVELTMPYSVIRGEAFTLKATVMNYLPTSLPMAVQLEASPDFTAVPVGNDQDSYCLGANGRHTSSWLVTPKSLGNVNFSVSAEAQQSPEPCGSEVATVPETGRKDTVVKVLIVEPEGIKREHTFSSLLCASDAELSETLSLLLPPTVVKDSARAHFSVMGDILSSAIKNTQNLIQMPYGCGEQNMVLFAPSIYVLKYLNETQQLTEKIKSKALGYLRAGYQRELNYKHKDGSYSAFGDHDGKGQGNTWLTAFVLKSFSQAQAFIFIDESHITDAFTWLSHQQKDSGCFRSSGSLFNNAMKGGVDDEITLSAYITVALLESLPPDTEHPVVSKALSCLESSWENIEQGGNGSFVYTKALMAYAFALAGNQEKRNEILKSLDKEAIKEDNSIHWERPQKPMKSARSLYKPQASSAEVEMNAYVILARLTAQSAPSPKDLALSMGTIKWLTKQQNSRGGFSSTQDTVVALDALSKYGAATFSKSQKTPSVTVQSSGSFFQKFQVDNSNRLLLQQVSLPDIPGNYTVSVSGEGCVYAQTMLRYNLPLEKQQPAFALKVQTVPLTCNNPKGQNSFQISLEISYTGSRPASNMVIADVKMLSGFIPLKPTVKKLERLEHVSRTEVTTNNVLLYLDQVTNQTLSFSFIIQQDIPVKNLQPAIVKVYDYYETDEVAFAEYSSPCSSDNQNV
ncbi:C3 and PZP-like, alpha-2-macroglobulin domain containing 8 isoform X2 [Rattus norvegicus]|uniref:C3 and PZP-like, alpha-2-macroglobulin domain containing 8 n=2 Tax=Rattus norvegicus TaxID=10116 RepID=A0A8I6AMC9_RAT|nr:C3 and PZP-like, alpha-2-macroglobulin domain containing 8 isoform X3 [Rattus norvegicus]